MFKTLGRKPRAHKVKYVFSPYKDAVDSLKEIREKLYDYKEPIEWDFVRLHFGFMHVLNKHYEFFYDIHEYVRTLFKVYECKDFSVIADTFQLESFICESNFNRAKKMTDLLLKEQKCCEIDGFNFVAKLMKMPYKNQSLPYISFYDVIQMHIVSVEKKILKDLLECGVMYIQLSDQKSTWTKCHKQLNSFSYSVWPNPLLDLKVFQANINKLSPESRQRMLAVFRGIHVAFGIKDFEYNYYKRDFVLCFRMAYETIPEPVITSNEVADFLRLALLTGPSADTCIDAFRKYYEKLFPESCEPLSPRTLKHLSRCQVRQNLRQEYTLPYGIKDLVLPTAIKKYITSVENSYMLEQYEATVPSTYNSYDHYDPDFSYPLGPNRAPTMSVFEILVRFLP